jgi:hypothetical protein
MPTEQTKTVPQPITRTPHWLVYGMRTGQTLHESVSPRLLLDWCVENNVLEAFAIIDANALEEPVTTTEPVQ